MNTKPTWVPEVPAGYVYLGLGGRFSGPSTSTFDGVVWYSGNVTWSKPSYLLGVTCDGYYAAHRDSEVARVNGYSGTGCSEKRTTCIAGPAAPSRGFLVGCIDGPKFIICDSFQDAEKAAEVLARKYPNNPFYIAEIVSELVGALVVTKK